jgi:hypothetical protein
MNIGFICFSYIGYLKLSYPRTYLECNLYENSKDFPRSKTDPTIAWRLHKYYYCIAST